MTPWDELGIPANSDTRTVRKAYAARVKRTRPDDDPAGFARLRTAYEAALRVAPPAAAASAAATASSASDPARRGDTGGTTARPAAAHHTQDEAWRRAEGGRAAVDIVGALEQGMNAKAARLLYAASRDELLPPGTESQLKDRLAQALIEDRQLRLDELRDIALTFDWFGDHMRFGADKNSPQARLRARIDADFAAARAKVADVTRAKAAEAARAEAAGAAANQRRTAAGSEQPRDAAQPLQTAMPRRASGGNGDLRAFFFLFGILLVIARIASSLADHGPVHDTANRAAIAAQAAPTSAPPIAELPREADPSTVKTWLDTVTEEAGNGQVTKQRLLGLAYLSGGKISPDADALAKNPSLGAFWLRRAADQSDPEALYLLGCMSLAGIGVTADASAARLLAQESADQHFVPGEYLLARLLLDGQGGPADPQGGFVWTRLAARALLLPAMTRLGDLYERGFGTKRDLAKSAAWRRAAAAAGDPAAMAAYGAMLIRDKHLPEAYRWLVLAIRTTGSVVPSDAPLAVDTPDPPTFLDAAKRDLKMLETRLSPSQRAAVLKELASWAPIPPVAADIDDAL